MPRKRLKRTRRDWVRRYLVWPLQGAVFNLVLSVFATLPRRPAASLGSAVAGFLGPRLSRQHARAIGRNLAIAFPNITEAESNALQRRILAHFGRVLSSYTHLPLLLRRRSSSGVVDVEGAEHLAGVAKTGPFILVGAHFGHWELPGCYAAISGCRMSGLYTPISNPWIDRAILHLRRKADAQAVLIPRGPAAVRKMMEALRDGRGLFILMDHRVDDGGEWLPFFGQPAQTATTPARLARRFNCPILLGRAILLPQDRYKVNFYEPLRPAPSDDENTDILRMTRAINTAFESWIREHPAQWLCTKRRWPKRRELNSAPRRQLSGQTRLHYRSEVSRPDAAGPRTCQAFTPIGERCGVAWQDRSFNSACAGVAAAGRESLMRSSAGPHSRPAITPNASAPST